VPGVEIGTVGALPDKPLGPVVELVPAAEVFFSVAFARRGLDLVCLWGG